MKMGTKKAEDLLQSILTDINTYFSNVKNLDPVITTSKKSTNGRIKKKEATCKYCGTSGFNWAETKWGWRMFDTSGDQHMCKNDVKVDNGKFAG